MENSMTETPQELIARLRFSAMDTLNRDKVRSEAREAADWIKAALTREAELREALQSVVDACDKGRLIPGGIGGMTIDANLKGSTYSGVPAWPVEEARAALEAKP